MIPDFTGRRPLPIREYVVSIDRVKSLATPCVTELDR